MSDSIIISESMREETLKTIHQGINSCIQLAKGTVYWPHINTDIEKYYINKCTPIGLC
jgi:hypothetical protein